MLNQQRVLNYIRDNLAFDYMHLEWNDTKIVEYFTEHTRREFSYYVPQKWRTVINVTNTNTKVPGIANEYYIEDPQGYEILNVIDFYMDAGILYLHGHPPIGPMSHGEIQGWALQVEMAMETKMFSSFDYTCEFKHPNIIRISPALTNTATGYVTVEYERIQPPDLSGIPNDLQLYFQKMALGDIMMTIGRIRKRYGGGNLRTPFGDIPLESDIYEEGKELKREVIEKLERLFVPNVRVDFG